ncbi:hypothetical protein V1639_03265 [Pseudarthrobacter sp. J75]|uniref:hypothetical protein n=1 Tax=unclassified Pseudarthrobacter TaxID=2647000 RepID=UPI002E80FEC2|nr:MULTISPECIES: hypothetical protein [unclassified Pseudarthrobacter]MEE2522305.1 hypothetical protein [Pseudarthrobacter sp. J47]MEE2528049.1 hypothetical protein [Pseudarthrobacter sp. J75]
MGDTASNHEQNRASGGGTVHWLQWLLPVLAVAVAVTGLVVILTSSPTQGWFAYAPLSTDFGFVAGNAVILNRQELAGWAVVGLGIALLVFWLGYRIGTRNARRS